MKALAIANGSFFDIGDNKRKARYLTTYTPDTGETFMEITVYVDTYINPSLLLSANNDAIVANVKAIGVSIIGITMANTDIIYSQLAKPLL